MRILYVSQYFPPEPGAPAARVSELARAWVGMGHEVTVLTGMPHHPTGVVPAAYRRRTLVTEDYYGVRVVRTWIYAASNKGKVRRSLSYASFATSAVALGEWLVGRPDVLVATSPQFLCAVAGQVIAAWRRTPFVFEVRDLWPESVVAVGALPKGHPVVRGLEVLERLLYRSADCIVVVTDAFRSKLVARGVDEKKIAVIKNGVDLSRFTPGPRDTDLRRRLSFGTRFVVGYVGTHGMAHGLGAVLDVARQLRERDDIRFLFVGEGAERQALQARAETEAIHNATFLGAVPREQMPEVYRTVDLCLVPLRKTELFTSVIPSKIFEILAMQRPILLSVDGEARRIVEESEGGMFVPPEDRDAMRNGILELCADRERCEQMGLKGRDYVMRHFDRSVLAREYLDILRRVASAP